MSGFTPVNQVRLTNVASVRLQKKGKRFEIACYRNKVLSWRNKLETDIREVLQIDTVFTNVSKGNLANTKDLMDAFGTTDQMLVCQEILDKGELQVSEQERGALYETIFRDIASIVADKTVNPENNRPYTITMIQNAMRQIQYSVNVSKSSKSQALDVIRKLRDIMPIARASMLVRVIFSACDLLSMNSEIEKIGGLVIPPSTSSPDTTLEANAEANAFVDVKIDPENFRKLEDTIKVFPGRARVEVLQLRMAGVVGTGGGNELKEDHLEDEDDDDKQLDADTTKLKKQQKPILTKREEKQKSTKDDLSKLLSELTGRDDLGVDEEELGNNSLHVANSNKKKTKFRMVVQTSGSIESTSPKSERPNDPSSQKFESSNVIVSSKVKVGKKEKRLEKDEKHEKEMEAKLLQERINHEQKKKHQSSFIEKSPAERKDETLTTSTEQIPSSLQTLEIAVDSIPSVTEKLQSCNTCGGHFHDVKSYREHFKSEWHRFNLKRKMKNMPVIKSEEEFLSLSIEELQI